MTEIDLRRTADAASPPIAGGNKPQPITTLRDWLDHLAAHDRLAVIRPEHVAALRAGGHRQALRRRQGDAVSASRRARRCR